jgi:hypothetical protein
MRRPLSWRQVEGAAQPVSLADHRNTFNRPVVARADEAPHSHATACFLVPPGRANHRHLLQNQRHRCAGPTQKSDSLSAKCVTSRRQALSDLVACGPACFALLSFLEVQSTTARVLGSLTSAANQSSAEETPQSE